MWEWTRDIGLGKVKNMGLMGEMSPIKMKEGGSKTTAQDGPSKKVPRHTTVLAITVASTKKTQVCLLAS